MLATERDPVQVNEFTCKKIKNEIFYIQRTLMLLLPQVVGLEGAQHELY
jgi:hypothetical protein